MAGFGYKGPQAPYGSMTAAGVAILEICKQSLGSALAGRSAREVDHAVKSGVAWLAQRFSVEENPGTNKWLYYYLYGLERIGALLEMEHIGEHAWYVEGAEVLLKRRQSDGSWLQKELEADTCFALLFLKRATAPTSGVKKPRADMLKLESPQYEVSLRALGETPLTVWITGFGDRVTEELGFGGAGPRVLAVEYLRDGEVFARVEGDPRRGWSAERYAAKIEFERRGVFKIDVRVLAVLPEEPIDMVGEPEILEAEGFTHRVEAAWETGMEAAAQLRHANLLITHESSVEASSVWGTQWTPELVCDGIESTAWLCAADDASPHLTLDLGRGIRATVLVLGSIGSSAERARDFDRIRSVDIVLNDKQRFHLDFDADPRRAARLELEKRTRIRTIRIENIERDPGSKYPGGCGFSEVALIATQ